jgi:hypothetical protein
MNGIQEVCRLDLKPAPIESYTHANCRRMLCCFCFRYRHTVSELVALCITWHSTHNWWMCWEHTPWDVNSRSQFCYSFLWHDELLKQCGTQVTNFGLSQGKHMTDKPSRRDNACPTHPSISWRVKYAPAIILTCDPVHNPCPARHSPAIFAGSKLVLAAVRVVCFLLRAAQ